METKQIRNLKALRAKVVKEHLGVDVSADKIDEEYIKTHEQEMGVVLMLQDETKASIKGWKKETDNEVKE